MLINIRKTSALPKAGSFILLGDDSTKWERSGLSKDEATYVRKIFEEKTVAFLNRLDHYIIIVKTEHKDKEEYKSTEKLRKDGYSVYQYLSSQKVDAVTVKDLLDRPVFALALAEGIALSSYRFDKYQNKKNDYFLKSVGIISAKVKPADIKLLNAIVEGTFIGRDLVNEPNGYLSATVLGKELKKLGKKAGFTVTVFDKKKIIQEKMGGLLAVNKGSVQPPSFSILEWKPTGKKVNKKPVVLVGKGVVFDTGGVNIKPTQGITYMKADKGGAAAVAGVMYAVAKAQLPIHLIGLIPATDNRPGGDAYVPGDVIKMHNGKTVEVLNTDAEGRMILADALSYAKRYKPELVIDLATLTGAAARAIGPLGVVAMGNSDEKMTALKVSGNNTYERIAEMPFWEEYGEAIKSDVADIKNIGDQYAGMITAGKFLEHFIDYPWLHLDIAGPAFLEKPDTYKLKGGTGSGVRLLVDFLKNY